MAFEHIPNEILGRAINDVTFRLQLVRQTTAEDVSNLLNQQGLEHTQEAAQEIADFNTSPYFQAAIRQELLLDETAM